MNKKSVLAVLATVASFSTFTATTAFADNADQQDNKWIVVSSQEIDFNTRFVDDPILPKGVNVTIKEGTKGRQETVRIPSVETGFGNKKIPEKQLTVVSIPPSDKVVRVGTNENTVIQGIDPYVAEKEKQKKKEIEDNVAKKAVEDARARALKQKSQENSIDTQTADTATKLVDTSATGMTTPQENREFLASIVSGQELQCADAVVMKESGYRTDATNPSSGAYGVAQSLPAGKYASHGADWRTNGKVQILWMKDYVNQRYGGFCGALEWHKTHNWY